MRANPESMAFPRAVLLLALMMFGGFGVWLLIAPENLAGWVGITTTRPGGATELRALYGGLEIGLAGFMVWGFVRAEMTGAACLCLGLSMAGIAIARCVGLIVDGSGSEKHYLFLTVEIGMAAAGFLGWLRASAMAGAARRQPGLEQHRAA